MNINTFGQVTVSSKEAFDALYSGKIENLNQIFLNDQQEINLFNQAKSSNADDFELLQFLVEPTITVEDFHKNNQKQWFMPVNYCPNLIEEIYQLCQTEEQINRVNYELELFAQHNMLDLLYYLKYLVDTMRKNNIVWGVGRGSSVSSYILFLLGIHKVDSLRYNLDIHEFLK